jgi:hypothetical protein
MAGIRATRVPAGTHVCYRLQVARLSPCSACGVHIRTTEPVCPFCGARGSITASPLGAVLLGLSLTACAPKTDEPRDDAKSREHVLEADARSEALEAADPPPDEPENATTGAPPEAAEENEGTDDGAGVDPDPPPDEVEKPDPRPRHPTKYGGPPRPRPSPRPSSPLK